MRNPQTILAGLSAEQQRAVLAPAGPVAISAGAGTGKTRTVTHRIAYRIATGETRPEQHLVITHSRKAASELRERLEQLGVRGATVRTFHAHALAQLVAVRGRDALKIWDGQRKWRAIRDAARAAGADTADAALRDLHDEISWAQTQNLTADTYQQLSHKRGSLRAETVRDVFARYTAAKRADGAYDFDDLLGEAAADALSGRAAALCDRLNVLTVDEYQDVDPAQEHLLRAWLGTSRDLTVVGDVRQCHPPGTLVRTKTGDVPIEELDPENHSLRYLSRHNAKYQNGVTDGIGTARRPIGFAVAGRQYSGDLVTMTAAGNTVEMTPDHRCLVRWDPDRFTTPGAEVVYLMRRGRWWRVGRCKLSTTQSYGFAPTQRLRAEKADAMWLLHVTEDPLEASMVEATTAARYGLPMTTFEPSGTVVRSSGRVSTDRRGNLYFRRLFESLEDVMTDRAHALLAAKGLSSAHPFVTARSARLKQIDGRGRRMIMTLAACNLIPGWMEVPVDGGGYGRPVWSQFTVTRRPYDGPVYSLDVERHENYVANGISVHNCIYRFKGATPAYLDNFAAQWPGSINLELVDNYRSTPEILVAANRIAAARTPLRAANGTNGPAPQLTYTANHATEADLVVDQLHTWHAAGISFDDMAVLYRFNSTAARFETALGHAGIPIQIAAGDESFWDRPDVRAVLVPFGQAARQHPDWDGISLLERIAGGEGWVRDQPPEGAGAGRERWELHTALIRLAAGQPEGTTAGQLLASLQQAWAETHIPHRGGVSLGTVHKAKGLEWRCVIVVDAVDGTFPAFYAERPEELTEERNIAYVAVTRAKQHLLVVSPRMNAQHRDNTVSPILAGALGVARSTRPAGGQRYGSGRYPNQRPGVGGRGTYTGGGRRNGPSARSGDDSPGRLVGGAAALPALGRGCAECGERLATMPERSLGRHLDCVTSGPLADRRARIAAYATAHPGVSVTAQGMTRLLALERPSAAQVEATAGVTATGEHAAGIAAAFAT